MIHGILNLDKPREWTSHDAVAKLRRILGQKKIGHAGTLDPNATGVLLLCLGKATKLSRYFMQLEKEYHGFFRFGVSTDSQDADGTILEERDPSGLTREDIEGAIPAFRGEIYQTPPMVSAVKVNGSRLYRLARRGETVDRDARKIDIRKFELIGWEPPVAEVRIVCSKGTYVRTLASDLGDALGCGAHLDRLTRCRIGPFHVDRAANLEQLESSNGDLSGSTFLPLREAISALSAGIVRGGGLGGGSLPRSLAALEPMDPLPREGDFLKIVDVVGRPLGVVEVDGSLGQLRKVLTLQP